MALWLNTFPSMLMAQTTESPHAKLIAQFRACTQILSKLGSRENIGFSPWGIDGEYIIKVDPADIAGATKLYEDYRNKPGSAEKDAALSSVYLLISNKNIQSFVVPSFQADPKATPIGRIKLNANYFYYHVDAMGAPSCFYNEKGVNINPYGKVKLTCPPFNLVHFNFYNEMIKKNPRVKIENGKHFSALQKIQPEQTSWIFKSMETKINDQLKDLVRTNKNEWRQTIDKLQDSAEVINGPDFMKYFIALTARECSPFKGVAKTLEILKNSNSENQITLDYHNKTKVGSCNP